MTAISTEAWIALVALIVANIAGTFTFFLRVESRISKLEAHIEHLLRHIPKRATDLEEG